MTKKPSIGSALASMKAKQPLNMTLAANKALGVFSEKQAALYGKMGAIESLGIGSALASMKAKQPLNMTLAANKSLGVFSEKQAALYGKMGAIESLGIGSALESFKASQSVVSLNIAAINSMIIIEETLAGKDLSEESCVKVEEGAIEAACETLSECSEKTSFKNAFEALPTLIQFLIWRTFLYLLLPIFISVTANLLTPYIKSYIEEKINFSQNISMNQIKRIPDKAQIIDATGLRFISGDSVRLRRSPSTSSEILDEMLLGQVVTVLSKKRSWIEVMYEYDDGEVLTGWVFTRYAKRFHR